MSEPNRQEIVDAFLREHGGHYALITPLGEGGYGFTYRARDERRQIDVCLKFFIGGIAPVGARRDWRVTSTLKHPLVCDTFTVEHFQAESDSQPPRVAVVSRFIAGQNLGEVVDRLRALPPEQHAPLQNVLVAEVGDDVCAAIRACHEAGHGHGDLSERNVMVGMHGDSTRGSGRRFTATVIDFDNATYKPSLRDLEESKLMEKDVRSLARLIGIMTCDSRWHDGIQEVLRSCETARQAHESLHFLLRVSRGVSGEPPDAYSRPHWNDVLRTHLAASTVGGPHIGPTRGFIECVADDVGRRDDLESERAALIHRIQTDPNYPQMSVSMEMRHRHIEDAARSLVE